MTTKQILDLAEVVRAFELGKTIQFFRMDQKWIDFEPVSAFGINELLDVNENLRIKPEAKKRLVTFDEMGPIVWVKNDGRIRLVIGFNSAGDRFHVAGEENAQNFANFANEPDSYWSSDRKTWRSFYVTTLDEVKG